jgi:hypothetical protein
MILLITYFFSNPDLERFEIPRNFDQWRVVVCTLECSTHISLVKEDMRGFFRFATFKVDL